MHDLDLAALERSSFRKKFRLNEQDRSYACAKGAAVIGAHATEFVAERLAPAAPKNDGKHTPWRGHPVFIAQHANATCRRTCLAKWHGLEVGKALGQAEQAHVVAAIERWLAQNA